MSAPDQPTADAPPRPAHDMPPLEADVPFFHRLMVRISFGLAAFLIVAVTATIVAVQHGGRAELEAQALRLNEETGSKIVLKLGQHLESARTLALTVAQTAHALPADPAAVMQVLPRAIDLPGMEEIIAGGGYWPEPGRFTPGVERRSFFWGRGDTGTLEYFDDYNAPDGPGYHAEEWYVPGRHVPQGGVYWSRSYMDPYSLEPMVTCTAPVWRDGALVGVSTIDLRLAGLGSIIDAEARAIGGYAFVVDQHNRVISFPEPAAGRRVTIDDEGRRTIEPRSIDELAGWRSGFRPVVEAVRRIDAGREAAVAVRSARRLDELAAALAAGSYQIGPDEARRLAVDLLRDDGSAVAAEQFSLAGAHLTDEPAIASVFSVPGAHWKVIVVTPASLATQSVAEVSRRITLWMVALLLAVSLVAAAVSWFHLVSPTRRLLAEVRALKTGDDETARIHLARRDELGRIAYWFNARTTRLAHAMSHLRRKNQALEHATRAAQEASRSKNVFLASMSHEIRTPMNAILGMTGILKETRLSPEQADFANTIQTSAQSLLSLINDIMDFSKIEAGRLDLESIDFDVRTVLEEVCDLVAFQAGEKGLDLIAHFNPRACTHVRGDPGRVRQILLNLAANAVKFTTSGVVAIHGDCELQPDGRPRLRFEVRDSGIGIPREALDRLFRPFSQVDDSTTRRYGGTGLGLAICRRLCELMDGTIGVESMPGSGSTFRFELLLQPAAESAAFPELPAARHALVVDPSAAHRRVLRDVLESWSFVTAECASADEVAAILAARPAIDLVFSGVPPEAHAGVEGAIRRAAGGRAVDVVVHASQHRAARYAVDHQAILRKPLKYSQLGDMLARLAARRRPDTPAAIRPAAPAPGRTDRVRVLIVEDNAVNQKVAQRLLARLGVAAHIVEDGRQAVEAVQKHAYELVLMDWQMPVMDGLEATRAIRALGGRFTTLPIIAVTANAMQGDRERCLAAGMNDYLSKPIAPDKLRAILDQWLHPAVADP